MSSQTPPPSKRVGVLMNHLSSSSGRLQGKNCVVTGAGSGIGRATSRIFAREGANVVCSDWNKEGVEETVALIKKDNGSAISAVTDVSDEDAVEKLIQLCCDKFGSIDVCYANAGINNVGTFFEETAADFAKVFSVNVIGVHNCFRFAAKQMDKQGKGGALLATASVAGVRSGAGQGSYSASKAAVINYCRIVANQLTSTNIRCNCICPGLIETGMTKIVYDMADARGKRSMIGQINPMLRGGEPEEIASVALFLASDDASYVNGQAICVDGGLSSSHPVARRKKFLST